MTPDQQRWLLELFAACSQDTITDTQHRELQSLMHADVEVRKLWFLYHDLELGLKCLTQVPVAPEGRLEEDTFVKMRSTCAGIGPGHRLPTSDADASRIFWVARRRPTIMAAAVISLFAMLMFGVHRWQRPSVADHSNGNKIVNNQAGRFVVESPTHGTSFTLSDQNVKLIAVHFLLKTECPSCLKLTHEYALESTSTSEVLHLFLKPDSVDEIKVWAGKISKDGLKDLPVIYRDPDSRLAKEFGIPDGYQFHGQVVHYPALVLLNSSGKELFRYVGKDNADRMWPDDFTAMLATVADQK